MLKQLLTMVICGSLIYAISPQIFAQTLGSNLITISDEEQLFHQGTHDITVKVIAGQGWGSGIILAKQGQTYTILTNRHVLTPSDDYQVQTSDGQIYEALTEDQTYLGDHDLAILQFHSIHNYQVASIAHSSSVQIGDTIFAVGFPVEMDNNSPEVQTFTFTEGEIYFVLEQPLQRGYRVGYTNNIRKGMSGGPMLNTNGEVIGINGRHAYPLWGEPFIYEDGSIPQPQLKEQMIPLSWGILSETFISLLGLSDALLKNSTVSIAEPASSNFQ